MSKAEGRIVWQTKTIHVPSTTMGSFDNTEGTQIWPWHTVGLLEWKFSFPFLGKSRQTSFPPKDQGGDAQLKGFCGCHLSLQRFGRPLLLCHLVPPPASPLPWTEVSLSVRREPQGLGSGLESGYASSPGASCPFWASRSSLCYPWSLWVMGSPGAWVGLCWVHKH